MKIYINIDGNKMSLTAAELEEMYNAGEIASFNKSYVDFVVQNRHNVIPYLHNHWDIGLVLNVSDDCKLSEEQINQRFQNAANVIMQYYGREFNQFDLKRKILAFENLAALDGAKITEFHTMGILNYITAIDKDGKKPIGSILANIKGGANSSQAQPQPGEE